MRCFWWTDVSNFGDVISKPILEYFTGQKVELAQGDEHNKVLAAGSIIEAAQSGDMVWGTGHNHEKDIEVPPDVRILAIRGPITRNHIWGAPVPEVYGDPAILLPLMFKPKVRKIHKIGLIPHYIDKDLLTNLLDFVIDIQSPWKQVVEDIHKCHLIVSSSLHGIIAAEAYGIPAVWAVWSDRIAGGEVKYQDYFLGTGRDRQEPFTDLPPIEDLASKQDTLLKALQNAF